MALTKEKKAEIVEKFARGKNDTGSAEVQYLAKKDVQRYREVVKQLGLRK